MDKINGFDPENQDWGCAIMCTAGGSCISFCTSLCNGPVLLAGHLTMGTAISAGLNYTNNEALWGSQSESIGTMHLGRLMLDPRMRSTQTFCKRTKIVFMVGFNSRSAFYSAFKQEAGMTPSQYKLTVKLSESSLLKGAR